MKEKTEFPGEVYAFTEEAKQILEALVKKGHTTGSVSVTAGPFMVIGP